MTKITYPLKFPPIKHDLQTRFGAIYDDDEKKAILDVLGRDAPTSNIKVEEFEKKFAQYCGTKYAISVSNGTAALMMAFKAIGIKAGDEVITTPITWIATAAAAAVLGAKIKFADVDPNTFNIDPEKIKDLITPKTKAICPVHLYGQCVDMDRINDIAGENDIYVVEDAAHAPGGSFKGKKAGSIGDIGCFSFHEQKNMSTLGEGGMITTNNSELYEIARLYKSHCARIIGGSTKYSALSETQKQKALDKGQFWYQDFDDFGYNFRMNDMSAAVGICQLQKLDGMNKRRNEIAHHLSVALKSIRGIMPLKNMDEIYHTYHLYPVLLDPKIIGISRENFVYEMRMKFQIKIGTNYMPLVQTEAFKQRGFTEADAPIAVKLWKNLAILPIHPRMTDDDVDYLINSIKELVKK